jgi:post-segregation antitoxin (ccd killing protein)
MTKNQEEVIGITVTLYPSQLQWCRENCINISALLRKAIDQRNEKWD